MATMIFQKKSDIKLSDEDKIEINEKIQEYADKHFGGKMPSHMRQTMRRQLTSEMKEGYWSNRDYVYGQDEGEPPKGANW